MFKECTIHDSQKNNNMLITNHGDAIDGQFTNHEEIKAQSRITKIPLYPDLFVDYTPLLSF
jgi:hypothetical protein